MNLTELQQKIKLPEMDVYVQIDAENLYTVTGADIEQVIQPDLDIIKSAMVIKVKKEGYKLTSSSMRST